MVRATSARDFCTCEKIGIILTPRIDNEQHFVYIDGIERW